MGDIALVKEPFVGAIRDAWMGVLRPLYSARLPGHLRVLTGIRARLVSSMLALGARIIPDLKERVSPKLILMILERALGSWKHVGACTRVMRPNETGCVSEVAVRRPQ